MYLIQRGRPQVPGTKSLEPSYELTAKNDWEHSILEKSTPLKEHSLLQSVRHKYLL